MTRYCSEAPKSCYSSRFMNLHSSISVVIFSDKTSRLGQRSHSWKMPDDTARGLSQLPKSPNRLFRLDAEVLLWPSACQYRTLCEKRLLGLGIKSPPLAPLISHRLSLSQLFQSFYPSLFTRFTYFYHTQWSSSKSSSLSLSQSLLLLLLLLYSGASSVSHTRINFCHKRY